MSSYATTTDLYNLALPAAALPTYIGSVMQQSMLDTCSDIVDSYIGARFRLPLTTPTASVKYAVCALAAYKLLLIRGYNPEVGKDEAIKSAHDEQIKWLEGVADGSINPPSLDSSPGGVIGGPFTAQVTVDDSGAVSVAAPTLRGW